MAGSPFSNLTQNLGESIQIELVMFRGLISLLETGITYKYKGSDVLLVAV